MQLVSVCKFRRFVLLAFFSRCFNVLSRGQLHTYLEVRHFLVDGNLLISFVQEIIQEQYSTVANYSQSSHRHSKHPNRGSSFTITCQRLSWLLCLAQCPLSRSCDTHQFSFLLLIQFSNASSNFSTQLATMRNNLNVTSRNRPLAYSLWWQMQAKRLSLRWVRCGYSHNCPLCWLSYNVTALFEHHTIVTQHIAQCKWSQLPKIKCEGYGIRWLDRFILSYYPDDLFTYIFG